MTFIQYLLQKKLSARTAKHYCKYIERFLTWLVDEELKAEEFTYTDLLEFMRYCKQRGVTKHTTQNILGIVRHYCNYLILQKKRTDNPAAGVFIKGLVRKLPTNLLTIEEMEELYKQYSLQLHVDASKKIMFGLMVYQGITVSELMRLEAAHIKLKEGKIFIKGTKRTNERLLNLNANQIVELQQYISRNKFKEGFLFIEPV